MHLVGPYYGKRTWCTVHKMSNSSSCAWLQILTRSSTRKQFIVAGPTTSLRLHHAPPSLGGELKRGRYISPSKPTHTMNFAGPSSPTWSVQINLSPKLHLTVVPYAASYPCYGRSGIESRWGRDFPPVQTGPGAHPAFCKMDTGSFPAIKCGRGVPLTTHPLLVPRSWKSRAIPLPTLWAMPGL